MFAWRGIQVSHNLRSIATTRRLLPGGVRGRHFSTVVGEAVSGAEPVAEVGVGGVAGLVDGGGVDGVADAVGGEAAVAVVTVHTLQKMQVKCVVVVLLEMSSKLLVMHETSLNVIVLCIL